MAEIELTTTASRIRKKAPTRAADIMVSRAERAANELSKEDEHSIMLPILLDHRKVVMSSACSFAKLLDTHMPKWRPFPMSRERFQATMQALAAVVASTQLEALVKHLTRLAEVDKLGRIDHIPLIVQLMDYQAPRDKTTEMFGQILLLRLHKKLHAPLSKSTEGEFERLLRQSDHKAFAKHCAEESIWAVLATKYKEDLEVVIAKDEIEYWQQQLEQAAMIDRLTFDFAVRAMLSVMPGYPSVVGLVDPVRLQTMIHDVCEHLHGTRDILRELYRALHHLSHPNAIGLAKLGKAVDLLATEAKKIA